MQVATKRAVIGDELLAIHLKCRLGCFAGRGVPTREGVNLGVEGRAQGRPRL
jgi:hypothetical protein